MKLIFALSFVALTMGACIQSPVAPSATPTFSTPNKVGPNGIIWGSEKDKLVKPDGIIWGS